MKRITIYTDGSCLGNPGPGGFAVLIKEGKKETILKGSEKQTTNNRMELLAVINALLWVKENKKENYFLEIFSDSDLLVQTYCQSWKRKANLDLWAEFDRLLPDLKIEWHWVKGHARNRDNERCDLLAGAEAKKAQKGKSLLSFPKTKPGQFYCGHCRKTSEGLLGFLPDSGMIRVDCPFCGRYLKFAPPTLENLKRAKKRPLLSHEQLQKIIKLKKGKGELVNEKELKKIKTWTKKEAEEFLKANQSLF